MGPVLKQIPLEVPIRRLRSAMTEKLGRELTSDLENNWWYDLIEFALETSLYGSSQYDYSEYSLDIALVEIGITQVEAENFLKEWVRYINEYLSQFGLQREPYLSARKEFTLYAFGELEGIEQRFEVWIFYGDAKAEARLATTTKWCN